VKHIEERLKRLILGALKDAYGISVDAVHIETPADKRHGDYATNIAMTLAKRLQSNPRDIAANIKAALADEGMFDAIDIAGPGFINFYLDKTLYYDTLRDILKKRESFGDGEDKGVHINLEYVSANPTGILHVGHARGAAAGDSLARLLRKAGYKVTREFYVNDGGNQIMNLARSVEARYFELFGEEKPFPEDGYRGGEIIDIAKTMRERYGDRFLHEDGIDSFREESVAELLKGLKRDLDAFGVTFDVFYSEKSLYETGAVEETREALKAKGYTYEKEGALFLRTTAFGDEKDRVIVKSDGTYTYLLPDIAYHREKLSRGFDALIDILGADHHGYVPRLQAALEMFTEERRLEVLILQLVKVLQNGEEVKMSKRSGRTITLRDLIEEVGSDAIRYFFARHSLNTHMDLDLDLAIKQTNENPVYYAQYAHARIRSVFEKADNEGYAYTDDIDTFEHLDDERVHDLLAALGAYPSLIEHAAATRSFHRITQFIHRLAQKLHAFYSHIVILDENVRARSEKLLLLEAVRIVLKDALNLIGVSAPEKM